MSDLRRLILPAPPSGVTAVQASQTSATVSWVRVLTATSYAVERGGVIIASGITTTSYTDSPLATGSYAYRVRATGNNGDGPFSAVANVTLGDVTAPTAPTITATATSSSAISVALTAAASDATGIASYQLEWSPNGTSSWTVLSAAVVFPYSHTGLTASTVYYYRARATDSSPAANVGPYSATSSTTTQAATGSAANLTWTPPTLDESGAPITPAGHYVYASLSAQDWDDVTALAVVNTGSAAGSYAYGSASFTTGTTWFFWVRAYDSAGNLSPPLYVGSKAF